MDQRADNACGSHGLDQNGKAVFDYTCDDCMLPSNWKDYDESPEYIKYHDKKNHKKRNQASKKPTQN